MTLRDAVKRQVVESAKDRVVKAARFAVHTCETINELAGRSQFGPGGRMQELSTAKWNLERRLRELAELEKE